MTLKHVMTLGVLLMAVPVLMAAESDGCAAALSNTDAPNAAGTWDIAYDDKLGVEVTIGGATYTEELGAQGGSITIDHNGKPYTFNLDCSRPEVVCPTEAWPATVKIRQEKPDFRHQLQVELPNLTCDGEMVTPDPATCGRDTNNPECAKVCSGTTTLANSDRLGVIGETGKTFRLFLGAGLATNGVNCALLGVSVADADLITTGQRTVADWQAIAMANGTVETVYSGSCLWAKDVNGDGSKEALAVGATVKFTTGFTGARR